MLADACSLLNGILCGDQALRSYRLGPFYVLLILQSCHHLSDVGQILVMIKYTADVLLRVHGLPFVCCRYYTDPSGTFWQCNAKAIGSGSEGADSSLQEQYNKV